MSTTTTSLNKLVLSVLSSRTHQTYVTAREIKDALLEEHQLDYQIQTIIVVLNRFCLKGTVIRCAFAGPEVRERYGYYLAISGEAFRETKLKERLASVAEELFEGDLKALQTAVSKMTLKKTS
jgi:predicted transcriptional regulator